MPTDKKRKKRIFYKDIPYSKKLDIYNDFYHKHDNRLNVIAEKHGLSIHTVNKILDNFKP